MNDEDVNRILCVKNMRAMFSLTRVALNVVGSGQRFTGSLSNFELALLFVAVR